MENTTLILRDSIEEVAVTFEALTYDILPTALSTFLVIFLLYEDIFPKQLTGPGPNGERITLPVCQQTGRDPILSFSNPNDPILPTLDKCVNYMSARGWDRVQSCGLVCPNIWNYSSARWEGEEKRQGVLWASRERAILLPSVCKWVWRIYNQRCWSDFLFCLQPRWSFRHYRELQRNGCLLHSL